MLDNVKALDPPGRFLEKRADGYWVDVKPEKAFEKACQALRERKWDHPETLAKKQAQEYAEQHKKDNATTTEEKGDNNKDNNNNNDDSTNKDTTTIKAAVDETPNVNNHICPIDLKKRVRAGARLSVFSAVDGKYYSGKVLKRMYNKVLIQYDEDGQVENVDLRTTKIRIDGRKLKSRHSSGSGAEAAGGDQRSTSDGEENAKNVKQPLLSTNTNNNGEPMVVVDGKPPAGEVSFAIANNAGDKALSGDAKNEPDADEGKSVAKKENDLAKSIEEVASKIVREVEKVSEGDVLPVVKPSSEADKATTNVSNNSVVKEEVSSKIAVSDEEGEKSADLSAKPSATTDVAASSQFDAVAKDKMGAIADSLPDTDQNEEKQSTVVEIGSVPKVAEEKTTAREPGFDDRRSPTVGDSVYI